MWQAQEGPHRGPHALPGHRGLCGSGHLSARLSVNPPEDPPASTISVVGRVPAETLTACCPGQWATPGHLPTAALFLLPQRGSGPDLSCCTARGGTEGSLLSSSTRQVVPSTHPSQPSPLRPKSRQDSGWRVPGDASSLVLSAFPVQGHSCHHTVFSLFRQQGGAAEHELLSNRASLGHVGDH